jgi:60 kDa SS-A/Ro ribonucleoprotein
MFNTLTTVLRTDTASEEKISQTDPLNNNQVRNYAGGFVYEISLKSLVERFCILGTTTSTYYCSGVTLTREALVRFDSHFEKDKYCLDIILDTLLDINQNNRAPKHDPVLFLYAWLIAKSTLCLEDADECLVMKKKCWSHLTTFIRIGTHLLHFLEYKKMLEINQKIVMGMSGTITPCWGRLPRTSIAKWFTSKSAKDLAYQLTKYGSRGPWSQKDALRQCHPKAADPESNLVLAFATQGSLAKAIVKLKLGEDDTLPPVAGYLRAVETCRIGDLCIDEVIIAINDHGLVREHLCTKYLTDITIWETLLGSNGNVNMPLTALLRNLGKMSSIGLLVKGSAWSNVVVNHLKSTEMLLKSRIHPATILIALSTYTKGCGIKGSLTWQPVQEIISALDDAMHICFANVEPNGQRHLLALDVSGSMGASFAGMSITAAEASAVLALVTLTVEDNCHVVGFSISRAGCYDSAIKPLKLHRS